MWHAWERREKCKLQIFFVEKPEGKRPFWRPRRRWEDGIRTDLRDISWGGGVERIQLTQDRYRLRALVRTVMNNRALLPRSYLGNSPGNREENQVALELKTIKLLLYQSSRCCQVTITGLFAYSTYFCSLLEVCNMQLQANMFQYIGAELCMVLAKHKPNAFYTSAVGRGMPIRSASRSGYFTSGDI
jgi:hypothetical protein